MPPSAASSALGWCCRPASTRCSCCRRRGAGALLAHVVALIFLRLESHWMALASLALILITRVVVINVPSVTGGVNGLSVPVKLPLFMLAILLAVAIVVFYRLSVSWYGIAARAVREDPAVASSIGIAPRRIQTIAFVISGAVGGLAACCSRWCCSFSRPIPTSSTSPSP
jgi:branched-chain amino acid transport system permease protein